MITQDKVCRDFRDKEKSKYPKNPGEAVAVFDPENNVTKVLFYCVISTILPYYRTVTMLYISTILPY